MAFMHGWALVLGTLAVSLPVIIHLLTKPKPVRLPVSTLRFIRGAVQQRAARSRLRDWLILLLRTAAIILIALAIARPLSQTQAALSSEGAASTIRLVVVDVSQSMAAEAGGIAAMERARVIAEPYLQPESGLNANLAFAAAETRPVFDRPSGNMTALRSELAQCQPRPQTLNVAALLNKAAELFAKGYKAERYELIIVTDFQRTQWASADFSRIPEGIHIHFESVSPAQTPENLGLLRVATRGRNTAQREIALEVDVGNFSRATRSVQVELDLGSNSYRLEGVCPPGVTTTLEQTVQFSGPGWQIGEARLVGPDDALRADDRRSIALSVAATPSYVIVSREPASRRPSSSYFLERALVPYRGDASQRSLNPQIVRLDPSDLEADRLASADLIVLCRPGKLAEPSIRLLASLLRRGRAVLYLASETVDAINLKQLADAAGENMRLPVEFLPPASGRAREELFVLEAHVDQSPFSVFGEALPTVLGEIRVSQSLPTRNLERGLRDDVVAGYSDGSAMLVVVGSGAGTLAVWNADLASSSLPRSPAFVPLLGELVERLLEDRRAGNLITSGEAFVVDLAASVQSLEGLAVRPPIGNDAAATADRVAAEELEVALGQFVDSGLGVSWQSQAAGPPGVYRVEQANTLVHATAVGLPPEESDLRPMDANILTERLGGGRSITFRAADSDQQRDDHLWVWLAAGCVACLLFELLALRVFRV